MFVTPDPDLELREIERFQNRRAAARDVDPSLADRLTRLAQAHTHVAGGALLSLAKAGLEPGDPVVREAANRAVRVRARSAMGFYNKGDVVRGGQIRDERRRVEMQTRAQNIQAREQQRTSFGVAREAGESEDEYRRRALGGVIEQGREAGVDVAAMGGVGGVDIPAAVRGVGMALNAPLQELQGQFRNVVSNFTDFDNPGQFLESQSDLGIVAEKAIRGERVDTGSGWFVNPESEVGKERYRREIQRGDIAGHVITPGRWAANLIVEPGTAPFNVISGLVDGVVAIKADPAAAALGRAGAVRSLRNTLVSPEAAEHWLQTEGDTVVRFFADTDDWYEIWEKTGKKLPVDLVKRLARSKNTEEARTALRPFLGLKTDLPGVVAERGMPLILRDKPELLGRARNLVPGAPGRTATATSELGYELGRGFDIVFGGNKGYVRLRQMMPAAKLDRFDPDGSTAEIDRIARNAALDENIVRGFVKRWAEAGVNANKQFAIAEDLMRAVAYKGAGKGAGPDRVGEMTRMFLDGDEEARHFWVNLIGQNERVPGVIANGDLVDDVSPHLYVEAVGRFIPMGDTRTIRRETAKLSKILTHPYVEVSRTALEWAQMRWKESVLIRLAYPIRVIGEEQFRMAAVGAHSMFQHPLSYLAYVTGRKGGQDILGNHLDDIEEYRKALTRGAAGFRDANGAQRMRLWRTYDKTKVEYVPSWGDELAQLRSDPIVQRILAEPDLAKVKAAFKDGDLAWARKDMMEGRLPGLAEGAVADEYIDSVVKRISQKTGDDSRLIEALRTGRLNGAVMTTDEGVALSKDFVGELRKLFDEGLGPEKVKGQIRAYTRKGQVKSYDAAVERMFAALMGRRTNQLSRSPSWQQFYWKRMGELVPFMDEPTQANAIARAKALGVKIAPGKGVGDIDMAHADFVAKAWALEQTKNLLYDLSERGQFFDAFRLIFPFGEAWKEMVTRWGKMMTTDGFDSLKRWRRVQQGVQGKDGAGFFYENENGEEVFAYPGSDFINEKLMGVPIPLVGRVKGLSLMTEVLPGVGPVAQVGAAIFLPDETEWDSIRELIMPFGEPGGDTLRDWMPPWLQKFATAVVPTAEMQQAKASTAMEIYRYGVSTGEYDNTTEEGIAAAISDATWKATKLFIIRGFAQLAAPAAPSPEFVVEDKDGTMQRVSALRKQYFDLVDKPAEEGGFGGDYDAGIRWFLDTYGDDLTPVLQGKSYSVVAGAPVTKEGEKWERAHKQYRKSFPHVYGYFAPQGGDLHYPAYARTFERDERVNITPEQHAKLANNLLGGFVYRKVQEDMGTQLNNEQRAYLRQVRESLREQLPGYQDELNLPGRLNPGDEQHMAQITDELSRALRNPELATSPVGEAISGYLGAREQASQMAEDAGLSPTGYASANAMRDVRDWLRTVGESLAEQRPDFRAIWEDIFDRELAEDVD